MKKKIFLVTLMTALLACLFVIGVSATDFVSDYTSEVTEIGAGPDWADLDDKNATAVLKKANGEYIRIPLYYIYQANKSTELRHEIQTATGRTGFRYDWISEQLGETETLTHDSLIALDIPEGIKTTSGLNNYKALEEVVFPLTATGLPKSENHPTLKKVFVKQSKEADGTIKGITTISDYAFKNAKALEYFKFELDYTTYIGGNTFLNCAVKELRFEGPMEKMGGGPFGGCSKLERIYINNTSATRVNGGQMFSNNHALKYVVFNGVDLPNYAFQSADGSADGGLTIVATNVETIGYMAFKNMLSLTSVDISGPIKSIGYSLFTGCANLVSVKITNTSESPATCDHSMCSGLKKLETVTLHGISIGNNAFRDAGGDAGVTINCTNVGSIGDSAFAIQSGKSGNVKKVNISGPITSIGSNIFSNNGKVESAIICVIGNPFEGATSVGGVTSIIAKDVYEAGKETTYATGKHIVYGYSVCELLYNGNHAMSGNDTMQFNGFFESITFADVCTREGCGNTVVDESKTIGAIFTWKGFSVSKFADANGCYSVTQGFYVDMEAIKAYAAIKTDFAFGVVASVGKENPISIVDGAVVAYSNVIFAPISKNANGELSVVHNYFDIKVTGIDAGNLDTKIAFNGYVVDGGEIYYLHAGETSETAVGSSYNEVK